ncbi:hypothetical protein [Pseudomonas aeruginosa]|uniref:hypothetical protein n=1 Tax=Pseudomonas aeruginosa TaxID=287 RepID=UPI000CDB41C4|nr:hypothetical protein [Pseudomonas aeruginosa]POO64236.1 hypothetical protein C3F46_20990 [Pseudomonas aeruginosa]
MNNCPHEAWDFGALQCSDCGAVKDHVTDAEYAKLAAEAQALREEVERCNRITVAMALDISAVGEALGIPGEEQEGGTGEFIDLIRELQKEVESLRARVVVTPDASAVYAALDARERLFTSPENIQVALEAQSRLNGLTVSEGLLLGMAAFALEIISGALEGGSFDGADIQESAERHGLIAKQVMNEPCRGPEEYCACAWSTSFPTECYRITAELRALLNQDKENGNG